jgi:predicted RNase H-like HicB family nuclease
VEASVITEPKDDAVGVVRLTAVVARDGQFYVARAIEVELASQGDTPDEALANLREAAELLFEDEPAPSVPSPTFAFVDVPVHAHAA